MVLLLAAEFLHSLCSRRAEAEAGDDHEEPDGHGSADPRPGSAEATRRPGTIRASLHGEVGSIFFFPCSSTSVTFSGVNKDMLSITKKNDPLSSAQTHHVRARSKILHTFLLLGTWLPLLK